MDSLPRNEMQKPGGQANRARVFTDPPDAVKEAGIIFTGDEVNAIPGENAVSLINK